MSILFHESTMFSGVSPSPDMILILSISTVSPSLSILNEPLSLVTIRLLLATNLPMIVSAITPRGVIDVDQFSPPSVDNAITPACIITISPGKSGLLRIIPRSSIVTDSLKPALILFLVASISLSRIKSTSVFTSVTVSHLYLLFSSIVVVDWVSYKTDRILSYPSFSISPFAIVTSHVLLSKSNDSSVIRDFISTLISLSVTLAMSPKTTLSL